MYSRNKALVVRAKSSHLEQIWDLERRIFADDDRFSKARLRYLLGSPNAAFFLGLKDNLPIGYGIALKNRLRSGKLKGRVYSLGVLREFRTHGVGTKLLDSLEHWLVTGGVQFITLETKANKNGAKNFFARRGYEVTEFLPRYYSASNGLRMRKPKPPSTSPRLTRHQAYSGQV